MKLIHVIFLSLLVGCGLQKKSTVKNFHKPDLFDNTIDSSKDLILSDIEELPKLKPNKILLTSGKEYYPPIYHDGGLKIIEVKNTKVIKQSNNFSDGRIVYRIPNIMKVRSTYKVLVRISKSKSTVSIYDSLSGEVMTSKIPVTETMEVKLIDVSPKDKKYFDITDGNNAVQIIENGDTYTEWSWDVTPIHVGKSKLKIVVSVIRNDNKKDIVYEDTVEIERDIKEQIKFFFGKYWQWIIGTLILPFIIWLYKNRKEKKEKEKEKEEEKNKEDGKSKIV